MTEFLKYIAISFVWFYLIYLGKVHFYKMRCKDYEEKKNENIKRYS